MHGFCSDARDGGRCFTLTDEDADRAIWNPQRMVNGMGRKFGECLQRGFGFEKIIIFYNMKCEDVGMTSVDMGNWDGR